MARSDLAQAPVRPATPSATAGPSTPSATDFDYTNPADMTCLLCQRKLKSVEQLSAHVQKSALHKVRTLLFAGARLAD